MKVSCDRRSKFLFDRRTHLWPQLTSYPKAIGPQGVDPQGDGDVGKSGLSVQVAETKCSLLRDEACVWGATLQFFDYGTNSLR